MGGLGLLGADLPEAFGGLGASGVTAGIIAEELAYGDFNISAVPVGVSLLGAIIMSSAAPAVAGHWVPPHGQRRGAAWHLRDRAERRVRRGEYDASLPPRRQLGCSQWRKNSITFADCADAFIVFARTGSPESGAAGITAMIVPANTPGVARTRFNDVGSRIIGRGSVFFEDVRVPVENRLGEENQGFTHVMRGFDYSRALIALECVGSAQASLDEAWEYTKTRTAFGAPIAQYQGVTFPLVEGETNIAAVRQPLITPWNCAMPESRIRRKPRWSNGSAPRPRSTSFISAF